MASEAVAFGGGTIEHRPH